MTVPFRFMLHRHKDRPWLASPDCMKCKEKPRCTEYGKYCEGCLLEVRSSHPTTFKERKWTREQDLAIRDAYLMGIPHRCKLLAKRFGADPSAIQHRASVLGVTHRRDFRPFTEKEDEYIYENAGKRSLKAIASSLKRTVGSVESRFHLLKLSSRVTEGYTFVDVLEGFGISGERLNRWLRSGMLRYRKRAGDGRGTFQFLDRDIRDFIRKYPDSFDIKRVNQVWFINVLAGIKYDDPAEDRRPSRSTYDEDEMEAISC